VTPETAPFRLKALVALPALGERDDCLDLDRHAEWQLAGADR
jgi:hypothetical protein